MAGLLTKPPLLLLNDYLLKNVYEGKETIPAGLKGKRDHRI